jgi:hypothetical protein
MPIIIPSPYKNYPDGYPTFQDLIRSGHKPKQMGFHRDSDTIFRFSNRFRLARAFVGINLDSYGSDTCLGYDGLMRVFLAYSAFELFLQMIGKNRETVLPLLQPYKPSKSLKYILQKDGTNSFYRFVSYHCNPHLKNKLAEIHDRRSENITHYAAPVRHIFAHGHLSAHPSQCHPKTVRDICDCLFDFHIKVMNDEFSRLLTTYRARMGLAK